MKVFSVDKAISKNKAHIELRGELYEVRDLTVRERIEKIREFKERQERREAEIEESGDDSSFDDIQDIIKEAIQEALVGVPDEVAETITEAEWAAIQSAMAEIRRQEMTVEAEDRDNPKE